MGSNGYGDFLINWIGNRGKFLIPRTPLVVLWSVGARAKSLLTVVSITKFFVCYLDVISKLFQEEIVKPYPTIT